MPIVRALVVLYIDGFKRGKLLTIIFIDILSPSSSLSHNMGQYLLKKTIQKHYDSINALVFSHDRSLFTSAADDGLIIIFQANGSGWEVHRFQVKAPATTLLWRSRFGNTLVAGDTSGDVHTICLNPSTNVSVTSKWTWSSQAFHLQGNTYYHTINCLPGPVHCVVENGIWLAVGSGKVVQLVKQATIGAVSWLARNSC